MMYVTIRIEEDGISPDVEIIYSVNTNNEEYARKIAQEWIDLTYPASNYGEQCEAHVEYIVSSLKFPDLEEMLNDWKKELEEDRKLSKG